MVRILMLSKWHVHAEGYAKYVQSQPDAKITCVWDEDPARGAAWAKELGVDFEDDLGKALARSDVDGVVVNTATSEHCRVMVAAADAKKHIFTEKALAPTVKECKIIAEAIAKNGVKFCISHPHLTTSIAQYCKQAIADGILGKINYMRMRTAHDGSLAGWLPSYWYDVEKAGGGAMMDLGCHPMYTAAYLLGKPKRIASIFNTTCCPPPADDHAVSVAEFENNAIAVSETGFVSPYGANCFELLGTEGAVVQVGNQIKVRSNKFKDGWIIPDHLPDPLPPAMRMWLDGIIDGKPIPFGTERGIALTELLENAYISHKEQRIITL
ncbi:MAG: Gfo/Idh/MocA family oxidoreductase [Treponema sp.]|jgi:predicted dehydrogenase|nr:Gfo/Idh/MocA family oxidoreductase [Treponema sp.]